MIQSENIATTMTLIDIVRRVCVRLELGFKTANILTANAAYEIAKGKKEFSQEEAAAIEEAVADTNYVRFTMLQKAFRH